MRDQRFTFLCSKLERQLIKAIAGKLSRSQGDSIRVLIYRAADELGIDDGHWKSIEPELKEDVKHD